MSKAEVRTNQTINLTNYVKITLKKQRLSREWKNCSTESVLFRINNKT